MSEPAVIYEVQDRIGVITLNRPDNRNSMTPELLNAFHDATREATADPDARCIVITGKGRCFSAGADLRSQVQRDDLDRPLEPHERSYAMYRPFLSVLDIEVPTIGALNGHTVGGGFGLSRCSLSLEEREHPIGDIVLRTVDEGGPQEIDGATFRTGDGSHTLHQVSEPFAIFSHA